VAERIPNANPFQDGIVEKDPRIGVAPFFTSTSETEALYNLNVMRTRYILIDNYTANNQYLAMLLWQNLPTNNWIHLSLLTWHVKGEKRQFQLEEENQVYYDSMLYRLYFLDGNNLQHLRLIYESPGDYLVNFRTLDVKTGAVRNNFCRNGKTLEIMQRMAQEGIEPHWADFSQNTIIYGAKPPVKEIKIFEKVAGAIIRVTAPLWTTVTLQINLLTNVGRTFAYTQTIRADVHGYQFIVPYATTAMQGKNYSSGVKALTPYIIQFADQRYVTVKVSEDAVQNGTVIEAGREE